jgi:ATP-dependent helicase/nuclease subunit A
MRAALDPLGETAMEDACFLETGTPPPLNKMAACGERPIAATTIPDALSRPIRLAAQSREIAPSYRRSDEHCTTITSSDEDGRQRGITIHRMLELMTANGGEASQAVTEQVALELGMAKDDRELRQWASEVQQLFAEPSLQEVLQPAIGEAINEVPIIYQQQDQTVHGVIDRLLLRGDEVWVIDYKTHRQATIGNLNELAAPYHEQLSYYAKGVTRLWPGKRVRTFLLFTQCRSLFETNEITSH